MTLETLATPLLALGMMFVQSGCSDSQPAEAGPRAVSNPPASTSTRGLDHFFVATGPLIVEHQIDVGAQRDGIVTEVHAEPGLAVRQGQLLAKLDNRQLTADLDAARARTRGAADDLKNWESEARVLEADAARAKKMWEAQLITQEQYDHARYKAESDQWDVKRAQEVLINAQHVEQSLALELDKTRICAPFRGIVARRYVRTGQQVNKGDRLFWVTEISPLRVKFTLPERFADKISRGQMFQVRPTEAQAGKYTAKVIQISPVIDPASGTIEVLAQLSGLTKNLRPGMTTDILVPDLP